MAQAKIGAAAAVARLSGWAAADGPRDAIVITFKFGDSVRLWM